MLPLFRSTCGFRIKQYQAHISMVVKYRLNCRPKVYVLHVTDATRLRSSAQPGCRAPIVLKTETNAAIACRANRAGQKEQRTNGPRRKQTADGRQRPCRTPHLSSLKQIPFGDSPRLPLQTQLLAWMKVQTIETPS